MIATIWKAYKWPIIIAATIIVLSLIAVYQWGKINGIKSK